MKLSAKEVAAELEASGRLEWVPFGDHDMGHGVRMDSIMILDTLTGIAYTGDMDEGDEHSGHLAADVVEFLGLNEVK